MSRLAKPSTANHPRCNRMPQETKARSFDADDQAAPGVAHENLEGWIPPLATDEEIRIALEKAFDYRGDVTITRKDGSRIQGYVFDRRCDGETLAQCTVRLLPVDGEQKISISCGDIARLEFTGRAT